MTRILGEEKPSLEDLAHHGVKGMHWGQRRGITDVHLAKVAKAKAINDRIVNGTATRRDKYKHLTTTPLGDLVLDGFKGSAAEQSQRLADHAARIESGNKRIKDTLAIYGSVTVGDLVKASRAKK